MDYLVHGVSKSQTLLSNFHFLISIHDYWKNHSFDYTDYGKVMSLLFNVLSRFVITFFQGASAF